MSVKNRGLKSDPKNIWYNSRSNTIDHFSFKTLTQVNICVCARTLRIRRP